MNEKKIELLPHLHKSKYEKASNCTEFERIDFDKLSYKEIRDLVYKNQQRLLSMTKKEQDALNDDNTQGQNIVEFWNSPIRNENSYRKQLLETYESIYWLDEIIDYYKSLEVTPELIKELEYKFKDDTLIYECLKHPGMNPFYKAKEEVFRELKIKTIIEKMINSENILFANAYELKDKKYSEYQLKTASYLYDHMDEVFPPDDSPRTFSDIFQSILSK